MANITEILGTDSVSSSRPIINSNFELLNDALASVTALLNPTTLTLSGLASISTASLAVVYNGTNLLSVNNSGAEFTTDVVFNGTTKIGGTLEKSGVLGTKAIPTTQVTGAITASAYFVGSDFTLPASNDGQEVTIINTANVAKIVKHEASASTLAAASITLDGLNSTVTLRCFENVWYVISSHNTTIV